jgi:hypothetical protein
MDPKGWSEIIHEDEIIHASFVSHTSLVLSQRNGGKQKMKKVAAKMRVFS